MAYRSFRDAEGTEWAAWDVVPRLFERRVHERRQAEGEEAEPEPEVLERRARAERRSARSRRAALAGLEHGWLCFEAPEEKRRLSPIPADWPRCDESRLRQYCQAATPTRRVRMDLEVERAASSELLPAPELLAAPELLSTDAPEPP
ncbi:MAG TPA: hypothetical protein VEA99_13215, partial [Gemmatimonadaceae bacterium]|nr:hypothetical protein [Gemmatimonadaceae bacterium]